MYEVKNMCMLLGDVKTGKNVFTGRYVFEVSSRNVIKVSRSYYF